jgi:Restriction endonuclease EcoRV
MDSQRFLEKIQRFALENNKNLELPNGDWIVKGFIDVFRNVYAMPGDTKVVSKIIELMLLPTFAKFAKENDLIMVLPKEQNFYPDLSFTTKDNRRFAVDIKTTYRVNETTLNTMTLGAFTGYFRDRASGKNVTFPYGSYESHIVFGVIYSRSGIVENESRSFTTDDLEGLPSAISNIEFFGLS